MLLYFNTNAKVKNVFEIIKYLLKKSAFLENLI